MKSNKTTWLIRTALGIALVIVMQLIGKSIPTIAVIAGPFSVQQLITGSLVNFVLLTMTILVGASSGVTVGIVSSIMATFLGIGPAFPIITPVIALGNAILVIVFKLLQGKGGKARIWISLIAGALAKYLVLSTLVPMVLKLIPDILPPQVIAMTIMFSWPQLITAMCGGILAMICAPLIKKGIEQP